jgi:GNAT superfamily N-acetyltransferase
MQFTQASLPEEIEAARNLFKEYEAWLGLSLCFQNFEQELAHLPGDYAPPRGRLLLVSEHELLAGCIALRPIDLTTCEMKRLFLRPGFRGKGLGRKMIDYLVHEARTVGYERMRLDTIGGRMDRAIALYRSVGFKEIEPYYDSPVGETIFMELDLVADDVSTVT